jgi:hypothetical protein
MECARGVARARDAVDAAADAGAGDATTDVVGQDNASSRRITKDSLIPILPTTSPLQSECPKIVRCRWCPSARCARRERRDRKSVADALASRGGDRRARRALLTRLVAAVGAAAGTTGTARNVHVSIKSFVSSRLVRLALWLSLSRLSRRRLRVRRIPSQPRFGASPRSHGAPFSRAHLQSSMLACFRRVASPRRPIPTGSRSRARLFTPQGGRLRRGRGTSPRSTSSVLRAPLQHL